MVKKNIIYITLCLFTLYIFGSYFILNLGGLDSGVIGDYEVYLKVAQALDSGNILYQHAIDTKNTGFFLVFYSFYKLYTLFNLTTEYIFLWSNIFLIALYFVSSVMIFHIVNNYTKNIKWAIVASFVYILYLSILEHAYVLNQPQIAQLFVLGLMLYYSNKKILLNREYFISGILLGLAFVFSSPYFIMVLSVPIISWLQQKNIKLWFQQCFISFLGFLLALLPFSLYFLINHAVQDWMYWNFEFLSLKRAIGIQINIPFMKNMIGMFFSLSHLAQTWVICLMTTVAFVVWIYIGMILRYKKIKFSLNQSMILIVSFLTLFVRLFLELHHSSYNFYYIPFLIIGPFCILYSIKDSISSNIKKIGIILGIVIILWVIKFPASFDDTQYQPQYDIKTASIIVQNLTNRPTFVSSSWNSTYSYSTEWESVGYSVYTANARYIMVDQPEVILGSIQNDDYLKNKTNMTKYESQFVNKYPINKNIDNFISNNYTKVSDIMYIRNNALSNWNLQNSTNISNPIYTFYGIRKRLKLSDGIKNIIKTLQIQFDKV